MIVHAFRAGLVTGLLMLAACGDGESGREAADQAPDAPLAAEEAAEASETLAAVRARGRLNCGVHEGLVGFAYTDNRGQWRGFDVDFCRATAAAVLGDPDAVRFVPLSIGDRFEALSDGRIDVLWRNTSWTMARDAGERMEFAGVNYYDGQGFLVRRSLALTSAAELDGARICVQSNSTTALNLQDYFSVRNLRYEPVMTASEEEAREAYAAEDCDAFTGDVSALAAARTMMSNAQAHAILPEVISKEPLGPVVRRGDDQWADIVRWTLNALILAEELGVTQANVDNLAENSPDPRIQRLLGAQDGFGSMMGLSDAWAHDAIAGVGNYGEIFDRNLGERSSLNLARGLNAGWNANPRGLMYGLPIR
ncbi:amino acid ABC transporter substrate-binding protein [Brevundimonas sp.]|uniref:amino acid ABC transporter substrate-binding protein n=1 Tax=Brevundimonas sp. TaxID=1871086 RepID=UPI00391BB480